MKSNNFHSHRTFFPIFDNLKHCANIKESVFFFNNRDYSKMAGKMNHAA